jgi:TolA-binding protein
MAGFVASAQQEDPAAAELKEGLRYAKGLQELRLPDIADLVITELEGKFPEAKAVSAKIKVEGELARGQFDVVKQRIAAEKDADSVETWAMKLALADAYYAYGKYPEAKGLYESFFERFAKETPPALQTFYNESAYKYAQMMLYLKELKSSLAAYERVLKGKLERHVERQCLAEMADVALRLAKETADAKVQEELYKKVEGWADKLLWVQDIWFGKAIVLKAHVEMLRGKPDAAKKLVDDYMGTLQAIHQALVEQEAEMGEPLTRVSPMAECRYLLAAMLQEESETLMKQPGYDKEAVLSMLIGTRGADGKRLGNGAYQHFINVFLKYAESAWAAEAGERAEQVRLVITEVFGGSITTSVTPEQTERVRTLQFRDARMLYSQGQVKNAKERLLLVLNQFPDVPDAVPALGDLARCFIQAIVDDPGEELYADTVIGHLAERFSRKGETRGVAGDELIRLAEYWLEVGRADKRAQAYDLFFANYPDHSMASSYMLSFGERHYKEQNYPAALSYFTQVAQTYSNNPTAFAALNRIASIYEETGDVTNQLSAIDAYVEKLGARDKPGQELMNARYRQAQAYKTYGTMLVKDSTNETDKVLGSQWIGRAAVAYSKLADVLKDPNNPYQVNDAERKSNASLHEAALYNMAYCLSQISQPAENVPAIRKKAIEAYEGLVSHFPKSPLAPTALIQVGSLWTIMRDAAKAEATLSQLIKNYPDSQEARSALPLIANNLMNLGMREEAVPRYRQMFAETGSKYSDLDLLRAAQVLTTAKEYDLAQQGLERVLARTKDKNIIAPAKLAQGNLLLMRGKYEEAVEALKIFIKEFSGYALMLDANDLLSRAASEAGMRAKDDLKRKMLFNDAVDAMKQVRQRRTNQVDMAKSDIEVGRIMARKAQAEVEFNKPEAAEDSRGKALISYQAFIDSTDAANLALAPLVETAYAESLPLLLAHKKWRFAAENCEAYLTTFPRGRFVSQMRTWLNQAQIELGASAGAKPALPPVGAKPAVAPPAVAPPADAAPAVPAAPAVAPAEAVAPPPEAPAATP